MSNSQENQTARGYEEPHARQFSLFLSGWLGQLKSLFDFLDREELEVVGFFVQDHDDWGLVRIVFADPGKAREKLTARNQPFTEAIMLLVETPSQESHTEVLRLLLGAEISVLTAYPMAARSHLSPIIAFQVSDPFLAEDILIDHGFNLIGLEDRGSGNECGRPDAS
ncbi:MAG: hypothetical protein ACLFVU_04995 [Phycisphaerae bacterium]